MTELKDSKIGLKLKAIIYRSDLPQQTRKFEALLPQNPKYVGHLIRVIRVITLISFENNHKKCTAR